MKLFYCLLLLLCPYLSMAQIAAIKPLGAGDAVPAITFTELVNSKTKTISLAALKGKLVILDFWATWCSACKAKFNLMDELQKRYAGQLRVILVNQAGTNDSREKLEKFFSLHKTYNGERLSLPSVYNDSLAGAYFPNTAIPHYVWISPEQRVLAITGPDELTAANIEAVIAGRVTAFYGLHLMDSFASDKPLFVEGNAGDGEGIQYRSTLSSYIPGMGSLTHTTRGADMLVRQYKMINSPLLQLITRAYNYHGRADRILFYVNDSIKNCMLPVTDRAVKANSYSYELITPPISSKALSAAISKDVERWFELAGKYEEQETPVYILTVDTILLQRYKSAGGKLIDHLNDADSSYIINGSLASVSAYMNERMDRYVIQQDSIGYQLTISLPPRPGNNCQPFIAALAGMGITLSPATRPVKRFIIYQLPKQL